MKKLIYMLSLILVSSAAFAQQQDLLLYNMNAVPQSMYTNPALLPSSRLNIGLPGISSIYGSFSSPGFIKTDVIYPVGGENSGRQKIDLAKFYDKSDVDNPIFAGAQVDLFSIGARVKQNYFAMNITEKVDVRFGLPKELIGLVYFGNADSRMIGRELDFSSLAVNAYHIREYGFQWAREWNEKLTTGVRLKYLYGMDRIYTPESDLYFMTDESSFDLMARGNYEVNLAGAAFDTSGNGIDGGAYMFGQANHGFGADIGAAYQINEKWKVSASIVNLGTISWKENPQNIKMNQAEFTFTGMDINDYPNLDSMNSADWDSVFQNLGDSISNAFQLDTTYQSFSAPTIPRFYAGGNYQLDEKQNVGLLLSGEFYRGKFFPGVTLSYNVKLGRLLTASAAYSYYNRSFKNLGLGFSFNAGPVQLYVVSDNVFGMIWPQTNNNAHIHTGINLTFGREGRDKDKDGILDKQDDCPDTPGLLLYNGCPDTDGDSIPDPQDACPEIWGVPAHQGCPDRDADGTVDTLDQCVDEPGPLDLQGCPDNDDDKIINRNDSCPDIPGPIETNGCPDKDKDGVLDMDDACIEKPGLPEHKGCPDTDGDGVYDHEDRCVEEAGPVENGGCPWGDYDKDGIIDKDDRCPDTPGPVENEGCPYGDMDGDGLIDPQDSCPKTPGPIENNGCPELDEEEEEILNTAFDNLEFESGKAIIKASSYSSLEELAGLMAKKPEWKLLIAGHTDNVGSEAANLRLSKERAEAVKKFMTDRDIDPERIMVEYYGESKPIETNATPEGRAKNRRVEMEIKFE